MLIIKQETMWNKIKQAKYFLLGQYYLLGIVLAALIYQFVTQSMLSQSIDLKSIIKGETLIFVLAWLIGGGLGGILYVVVSIYDQTRVKRESNNWNTLKNARISSVIFKVMFALSFGAFVGMVIKKVINLESYDFIMSSLFSSENVTTYIGAVTAACVFAVPLSIGAIKRLRLLYDS